MGKTKKRDLDKFLTRLYALQRKTFKKGNPTSVQIQAEWAEHISCFMISVTCDNPEQEHEYMKNEQGEPQFTSLASFFLYAFDTVEENEKKMRQIATYLGVEASNNNNQVTL